VTVRYASVAGLLADLKGMGERAAFVKGMGRPLPRRVLARMADLYAERFSDPDGRVRATFEIVYLSGWAPAPNQPKPLKPGSAKTSLADAVRKAGKDGREET
jgi:NADH dehydrogenase [ubiquinone] 1 alpha subcomplex assembly factor 5